MKRTLTIIGLGLAGMALAVGVSVAAFALVGGSLSNPASGVKVPAATPSENTSKTPSKSPSEDNTHHQTPSPATEQPQASPSETPGGKRRQRGRGRAGRRSRWR